MDAIAVTLAGHGAFVGVAPLGTALTPEQTLLLRGGPTPLIATDADNAGHVAAENAFWLLAQHRFDPRRLLLPAGGDPAQLLEQQGRDALHDALAQAATLQGELMIRDRIRFLAPAEAGRPVAEILAARPPATWKPHLAVVPEEQTRHLIARVNAWTTTPATAADHAHEQTREMRRRLEQPPADRWQRWADLIGLAGVGQWPELAGRLDELHHAGAGTAMLGKLPVKVPATVEVDWRPWAELVNPALLGDGWETVRADLTRLQAVGIDVTALAATMAGRDPRSVAVGLRNVLRQHNTQIGHEVPGQVELMAPRMGKGVGRDSRGL